MTTKEYLKDGGFEDQLITYISGGNKVYCKLSELLDDHHKAKVNEITDEEIVENARIGFADGDRLDHNFIDGVKWFKEQLLK